MSAIEIIMSDRNEPGLSQLRKEYKLDELIADTPDEFLRLQRIIEWANAQFKHNGNNNPSKSDPLTILKEASQGKGFRCVEYGIIVAAAARALGMPSRPLGLKREDVETAKSGAGHVVAEVWLDQYKKWVFVDGQYGVVTAEKGIPLNAVEFQDALARKSPDLKILCVSKTGKKSFRKDSYIRWIAPYLYYYDFNLDQRFFREDYEKDRYEAKRGKIMLVPKGASHPKVFQRQTPIKNCMYISNPTVFYPQMHIER